MLNFKKHLLFSIMLILNVFFMAEGRTEEQRKGDYQCFQVVSATNFQRTKIEPVAIITVDCCKDLNGNIKPCQDPRALDLECRLKTKECRGQFVYCHADVEGHALQYCGRDQGQH